MTEPIEKPVPDGHITIYTIDDQGESHFFKDIVYHGPQMTGSYVVMYEDHRVDYILANIVRTELWFNSDKYKEELGRYQLVHNHEFVEQPHDEDGPRKQYCEGCSLYEVIEEDI